MLLVIGLLGLICAGYGALWAFVLLCERVG